MRRRTFGAALAAIGLLSGGRAAAQDPPIDGTLDLAVDADDFARLMAERYGEARETARQRLALSRWLAADGSLSGERAVTAFLATPRHEFVPADRQGAAYDDRPLAIGYGQTISAPHMVAKMTSVLAVTPGQRVLEIGTGSGYQAAVLAMITGAVHSIEIVEPLGREAAARLARLAGDGYDAFGAIALRLADGYHGWPEAAPFDRIIVTAAIDHIPPPLLGQLAPGGRMLIPVGPPSHQRLLEVASAQRDDGSVEITRRDVYGGLGLVRFVPFTRAP